MMKLARIEDMGGRLIKNLSKGYKQRVGLAQAIISLPEIIILDEPTVGLDPKQIIEMRDLIRELGKDHTVILSSHILTEVAEVCDYVFIISHGKLVARDYVVNLENQSDSGMTLTVTAKGEKDTMIRVVKGMQGLKDYRVVEKEGTEEGAVTMELDLEKDVDLREQLSMELAKNSMPVLGMSVEQNSLEDVFLALTGESGKEEEANVFGL